MSLQAGQQFARGGIPKFNRPVTRTRGQGLVTLVLERVARGITSPARSGHELLKIAKEHGALVRFVGDTRQHVAVEAGDFGRTLEQHSNLGSVSISKISRQRDSEYRAAVMEMASSKVTEGLARLDQKGWIHEEKSGYLIEAAKRYLELSGSGKKRSALPSCANYW